MQNFLHDEFFFSTELPNVATMNSIQTGEKVYIFLIIRHLRTVYLKN